VSHGQAEEALKLKNAVYAAANVFKIYETVSFNLVLNAPVRL